MGRPWPQPGEPLFLKEDSDLVIALAEEERDTCPSCGYLKSWCRDPANQFGAFAVHEERCHATYVRALHHEKVGDDRSPERLATQVSVRFAEGRWPDVGAGLGLADVEVD